MIDRIRGIHHVTAFVRDAQVNLDFTVGVLGLRLMKRTVNFDDPGTWHFYFGDAGGRPGSIFTTFPMRTVAAARRGSGEVRATAFAVPAGSLEFWRRRLTAAGVTVEPTTERFGDPVLAFEDPGGLRYELVAEDAGAGGLADPATPLGPDVAIRGLHGVCLEVGDAAPTAHHLQETLGLTLGPTDGPRTRFLASGAPGDLGQIVDLVHAPAAPAARLGGGSVHHVAFRTADDEAQTRWRGRLAEAGLAPTPILDRRYFHSIYTREPGGVIFEFATDAPGFTADEAPADLGRGIMLPPWLESRRPSIESALPPVVLPVVRPAAGRSGDAED